MMTDQTTQTPEVDPNQKGLPEGVTPADTGEGNRGDGAPKAPVINNAPPAVEPTPEEKAAKEAADKQAAADKEAEVTDEWKSILDCMLLRRFFVWDEYESRIIGPIDDASIFNSLYWTECKDKNLDLVLKTDFQELSLKPLERFNYVVNKLKKHAEAIRYKIPGDYMDYHSCRSRVLNSTYAPWGDSLITNCLEDERFSDSLTSSGGRIS